MNASVQDMEKRPIPGKLVVFLLGLTTENIETRETVEVKTIKSAPAYTDVIPAQKIIKAERRRIKDLDVDLLVKAYPPDTVVVEASLETDDILSEATFDLKRSLTGECRNMLCEFVCNREFDEEYTVYCISGYSGDPEVYLSLYGDTIAAFLKNERMALDEEEVRSTLSSYLKYGKDDITIVDWDGVHLRFLRGFREQHRTFPDRKHAAPALAHPGQ